VNSIDLAHRICQVVHTGNKQMILLSPIALHDEEIKMGNIRFSMFRVSAKDVKFPIANLVIWKAKIAINLLIFSFISSDLILRYLMLDARNR